MLLYFSLQQQWDVCTEDKETSTSLLECVGETRAIIHPLISIFHSHSDSTKSFSKKSMLYRSSVLLENDILLFMVPHDTRVSYGTDHAKNHNPKEFSIFYEMAKTLFLYRFSFNEL